MGGRAGPCPLFPPTPDLGSAQLVPHTERRPRDDHWELPTSAKVPNTKYQTPSNKYQTLSTKYQIRSDKYETPDTNYKVASTKHQIPDTASSKYQAHGKTARGRSVGTSHSCLSLLTLRLEPTEGRKMTLDLRQIACNQHGWM